MKPILTILFAFATLTASVSCKQPAPRHPNLTMIEDESGETIKEDDFLAITYTEKTEEGEMLLGSGAYDDRPALIMRGKSYFSGDFFDMLGLLSEGDSARFKVNIDSITIKTGRPRPEGTRGKHLVYNVRINKVVGREKMDDDSYNAAIESYRKQATQKEKNREQQKIGDYLSKNQLPLTKTASGLMYHVTEQGTGNKPAISDTILANYTLRTLSGKVVETSEETVAKTEGIFSKSRPYEPVKVPVVDPPPSGFIEALKLFPKGTKVMLVIPSALAYGADNYKMLEPYTPLTCNLEIMDIIRRK